MTLFTALSKQYINLTSKVVFLFITCFSVQVSSTASLAAENRIDDIVVKVNGVEESYTVVRDAQNELQWYTIPGSVNAYTRTINGVTEPDFALIRYQFKDPDNAQAMLEGGLLQFAATTAISPEAQTQLKAAITAKVGKNKAIRISPIPFNEANVNIYSPGSGKLIAGAAQGAGIAPLHGKKMVFSIPMTKVGADVYEELVNGNTGIPVVIDYSFNGLTPPAGFRVEVDWDQTYKHYSKDQKFAAKASYMGLVGGSTNIDKQKIRETLLKEKCINVLVTEGESYSKEDIDKYLEPILSRINKEIMAEFAPPEKVIPAKSRGTSASGKYFSAAYSSSIKDISQVKKGTEIIDFTVRKHQVRKSVVSGFIGIGRYSKEIKERLVSIVPLGPWQSAFFLLPNVGGSSELGITQVDLEIGLSDNEQVRQSQVVVWTPDGGWKDRNGKLRTVLSFALMGLTASGFDVTKAKFKTKAQITLKREVLTVNQTMSVFDGETAIRTPLTAVDVVAVDGSLLSWNRIDNVSNLAAVNVKLQSGDRVFSGRLKPWRIDGNWTEPSPFYWLIPKGEQPVTASINYLYNNGKRKNWVDNGKDLLKELSSLEVTLLDGALKQVD